MNVTKLITILAQLRISIMAKEKKEEPKSKTKLKVAGENCGPTPKNPGGPGAGDWQCRDGKWEWITEIGG